MPIDTQKHYFLVRRNLIKLGINYHAIVSKVNKNRSIRTNNQYD